MGDNTLDHILRSHLFRVSKKYFFPFFFLKMSDLNLIQRIFYPLGYITYELIYDP